MPLDDAYSGLAGKVKFHIHCLYHGPVEVADSADAANIAAAAHIRNLHHNSEGVVAPNAEVTVQPVSHITTADVEQMAKPAALEHQ